MKAPRARASARAVAHEVLVRVEADKAFADRALDAALSRLEMEPRDRALCTELVYGTLRRALYLDFLLGRHLKQPMKKLPVGARAALRLGAYQLVALRTAPHAAVSESVELVRERHLKPVANAVLRKLAAEREAPPLPASVMGKGLAADAVFVGMPPWMLELVSAQLGRDETVAWGAANLEAPPVCLRANLLRTSRAELLAALEGAGVRAVPVAPEATALRLEGAGSPAQLPGFAEGWFSVQDPAAQLVGLLARPARGELALDLCSAPGSKATHLAELGAGRVVAVEKHAGKSRLITKAAARLGLEGVEAHVGDAADPELLRRVLDGREAGAVLLDAPCSGLGTLRKNPELRLRPPPDIAGLVALQDRLLDAAAGVLRPGGALVYSVCTVTAAEGPERITALLSRHPELALEWPEDRELEPYRAPLAGGSCLRTWTHRHGMDGFFAARLVRRG